MSCYWEKRNFCAVSNEYFLFNSFIQEMSAVVFTVMISISPAQYLV